MGTAAIVAVVSLAVLVGLLIGAAAPHAGAVVTAAAVNVHPTTQGVTAGSSFTINVTVENVAEMGADQATLHFDPNTMGVSQVTEGDFLKSAGETLGEEIINNGNGYVTFFYSLKSSLVMERHIEKFKLVIIKKESK